MKMDQLIAFCGIFGSCFFGSPRKNHFFTVPRRGNFGYILTMQLEPPKKQWRQNCAGLSQVGRNKFSHPFICLLCLFPVVFFDASDVKSTMKEAERFQGAPKQDVVFGQGD